MATDSFSRSFTIAPEKADMVRDMIKNPDKYSKPIKADFDTEKSLREGEELLKKLKPLL